MSSFLSVPRGTPLRVERAREPSTSRAVSCNCELGTELKVNALLKSMMFTGEQPLMWPRKLENEKGGGTGC